MNIYYYGLIEVIILSILGMSVNKGALIKLFPNCKFNYVEFTNNNILSYSDLIR